MGKITSDEIRYMVNMVCDVAKRLVKSSDTEIQKKALEVLEKANKIIEGYAK